ncbi:transcriptional regulator, MarR family [Methanosphaerula palustris E1-9c]|uniref:Transcriptional regulator, MarR family n=2 Tax=Methanosphaerula palustris TaxID=475088 RepID=B8GEL6_METPE|nr:transcriptional regulator, MarR family [Methanosphaerula palustris E1-9c]
MQEVYQIWMRLRNKVNEMESIPRDYGVKESLFLSEIHTIQAIGATPENNVRVIADLLGVTPSAASQAVTKLAGRGLVKKVRGRKNEREVSLELTDQGWVAYRYHEQTHKEIYTRTTERVGPLSEEELELIARFFNAFESVYDERIEELLTARLQSREVR